MTGGTTPAGATLRIALGEYDTGWHTPDASLASAESLVRDAVGCGARVVVLPEMAPSGFTMEAEQAASLESPAVKALQEMARRHDTWLVAGVALREPAGAPAGAQAEGSCVVNAALAIDPSGAIVAVHRKQRLFAFAGEDEVYTAGQQGTVVTIDGVRVGMFICYELRFPEVFAEVASQCDCMVVIANWPAARRPHWDVLLRARAIENQCAVLGVNRIGEGGGIIYDGGSAAYDAWGDPLRSEAGCGVPVVLVDAGAVAAVRERYPFARDRVV